MKDSSVKIFVFCVIQMSRQTVDEIQKIFTIMNNEVIQNEMNQSMCLAVI